MFGTPGPARTPSRRVSLAAASLAAALAGVCLVGTALIGPAAGRSIRVYNHGGLDWERPAYGQFGAFSGGMFGLFPVYCRAQGYDFEVIDKFERRNTHGATSTSGGGGDIASLIFAIADYNPALRTILTYFPHVAI